MVADKKVDATATVTTLLPSVWQGSLFQFSDTVTEASSSTSNLTFISNIYVDIFCLVPASNIKFL